MRVRNNQKYVPVRELDLLSLKFALGNTDHLTKEDAFKRCFLTKSSIALNKLNELHLKGDALQRKLELLNSPVQPGALYALRGEWLEQPSSQEFRLGSSKGTRGMTGSATARERSRTERLSCGINTPRTEREPAVTNDMKFSRRIVSLIVALR